MDRIALASAPGELTELLHAAQSGDRRASDELFERVYNELRRIAHARLLGGGRPGDTLNTTALVHETYLRLARPAALAAEDRAHFFNLAARAMRQIVVDHARRAHAEKRGGDVIKVELKDHLVGGRDGDGGLEADLVALDQALEKLEQESPRLAKLVELRFFAGLTLEEIGATVGLTERTMKRDWRKARAFLYAALTGELPEG